MQFRPPTTRHALLLGLIVCLGGLGGLAACQAPAAPSAAENATVSAPTTEAAPQYVPDGRDWAAVVGVPPAEGSVNLAEDVAILDWLQRARNPMTVSEAWAGVDVSVACFQAELSANVKHGSYPELYATIAEAMAQGMEVAHTLKAKFDRPRPFLVHHELEPCLPEPTSHSFPSGHATRGMLTCVLLSDLFPECKDALEVRGRQIGYLRVAAGMHYPSDVEAGQRLGQALGEAILTTPAWAAAKARLTDDIGEIRNSR